MNCSLTLNFASLAQLHDWVAQFAKTLMPTAEISAADRPDAGAPGFVPKAPAGDPVTANPFAAAVGLPAATVAADLANPFVPQLLADPLLPVAPAAPDTAALVAVTAPGGVDLDAKGLPWDTRIHGSTKTKNADGTWRQKRGLNDEALKLRIEGELRAAMAARGPAVPPAPVAHTANMVAPLLPPAVPNAPTAPIAPAASVASGVVPAAPAPAPSAPAAPVTAPAGETFGQLMARLAPITTGNAAAAEKVNQALGMFGLTALSQLPARPDLLPSFAATVDAMLAA